jgi:peptidoglycan/LPS O-acetylase OafA/YrhL
MLKVSGAYGWTGVEVFFVISGFVLPWSMYSAGYKWANYRTFLLKRIVRLDPPYLAAIAATIALAYVSSWMPGYRGMPPGISVARVAVHLAYLNVFFKYEWLNPVFWSLAIEFQYYLLIGLAFPLMIGGSGTGRRLVLLGLAALSLIPAANSYLPHFVFLFIMGILSFQFRIKTIGLCEALCLLAGATLGSILVLGPIVSSVGLATSIAIMFFEWRNAILVWLGDISYSLYLAHVPVGGRIINLGERFARNGASKTAFLSLAVAASIGAAYLMWRFVEKPSQRWAKAIRYRRSDNMMRVKVADGASVGI